MSVNVLGENPLTSSRQPVDLDDDATSCIRPAALPRASQAAPSVAGYEIIEELGRGGMGVVYKAWQHSLKRTVALKMVLAGAFARSEDLERFRAEAMAVARLHHPHLLSIYEIGECQQLPFYAMEYMEGGSLARRLNGQPIDPRAAAVLVQSLAEAMDYAHKNGIVHRDLKPANILLSGKDDTPIGGCLAKITDFGIAKHLHENTNYTRTGDILGTPHYMSPEQATGLAGKVGPTTDVYSLGAIFYELLTGRQPFHGFEGAAVLIRLTREEPTPPNQIVRSLPDDLQTICLKCLEKDPERRYASAAALADDLGRFLRSETIQAKPASLVDRAVKWTRRRPGWAAIVAMTIALAAFAFSMMTIMWRQAVVHGQKQDAMLNAWKALLADDYLERGIHLAEKGDTRGMHLMLRALEVAEEIEQTEKTLNPLVPAIRMNLAAWSQAIGGRERLLSHDDWAWDVGFTPAGRTVLTAGKDRKLKLWDAETAQLVTSVTLPYPIWGVVQHPDGKTLFTVCSTENGAVGELAVWTLAGERPASITPRGQPMPFAADLFGLQLNAAGDRLWVTSYVAGKSSLLAFDPDARDNGLRKIVDFDGGHIDGAFSPDGKILATIAGIRKEPDAKVHLWDGRSGASFGPALVHAGPARTLAFSRDGRHLIVGAATHHDFGHGESSRLHVWDVRERKCVSTSAPIGGRARAMTLAPNGQMLALSVYEYVEPPDQSSYTVTDGHVALWLLDDDGQIDSYGRPLHTHNAVWSLAFSPDSRLLLAGSRNSGAFLWAVSNCQRLLTPVWHEGNCVKVAFRGDGRQVVTASAGGNNHAAARIWDVPSFAHIGPPLPQPRNIRSAIWARDGKHAWFGCGDVLCRWDTARGVKTDHVRLPRHAYYVHPSAEHDRFFLEIGTGELHEYKLGNASLRRIVPLADGIPRDPQTQSCPAQRAILQFWYKSSKLRIINEIGQPLTPLLADSAHLGIAARLSPAGDLVAFAESTIDKATNRLRLLDARDLSLRREITLKHGVSALAFSPDGKSLAVATVDRQVQILNVQTGEFEGSPLLNECRLLWLSFAGPNNLLVTSGDKGRILVWHVPTGKRVGPAFDHGADLISQSVNPEGTHLLTGTTRRLAMAWRIPAPATGSANHIRVWIESITGLEAKDRGTVVPLDAEQILARRRQLADLGGPPIRP